jgi:hypothetical protein
MATVNKGVVIWRGDLGNPETHYSKSMIADVTDDAALGVLVTALAALTDCNAAKRSYLALTSLTDSAPAADANVDRKAVCYFRDPTTLRVHSITLPAPKASISENGDNERVTAAAMSTIVTAINTATGKSYTALYGVIIQKR